MIFYVFAALMVFLLSCFPSIPLGNCLGEEGCDALKEVMDSMNMGDLLGSLRYTEDGIQL